MGALHILNHRGFLSLWCMGPAAEPRGRMTSSNKATHLESADLMIFFKRHYENRIGHWIGFMHQCRIDLVVTPMPPGH